MPRRRRGWHLGGTYHLTHRCHEKNFLFKFKKYRSLYLEYLHDAVKRYKLSVLDYIVTSNHIHLLVYVSRGVNISRAIQYVHGRIGQSFNHSKDREGAFWKDRFHATRIQDGKHLCSCLFYIDLNMVRAGEIDNPFNWEHAGCQEYFYIKERKKTVDTARLLKCLGMRDMDGFRKWYSLTLENYLKQIDLKREDFWSKAIAVGDIDWLEKIKNSENIKRVKIHEFNSKNTNLHFLYTIR